MSGEVDLWQERVAHVVGYAFLGILVGVFIGLNVWWLVTGARAVENVAGLVDVIVGCASLVFLMSWVGYWW